MTVEEAIPIALDYVKKLFLGTEFRLEEVELDDDGSFDITVSYRGPGGERAVIPLGGNDISEIYRGRRAAIGIDPSRHYKIVTVSKDRYVKSVRIRQIVVG